MSNIHSLKASSSGLTAIKFVLTVLVFAASAAFLLAQFDPGGMESHAQATIAPESVDIPTPPASPSWSDQWSEVQKAIPVKAADDMPTF